MDHPFQRPSAGRGKLGRDWFRPLSGWFLAEMMSLEDARPGVLAHATRSSPFWRNSVAAALSNGARHKPESFFLRANGHLDHAVGDRQIADAFIAMSPTAILGASYAEVPGGFASALKKISSSLLDTPDAYRRLHALLTSNERDQAARRRVLERTEGPLDDEVLAVASVLDLRILTPKSVRAVRCAEEAERLNSQLPVIQRLCSTASDGALRQSVEDTPYFRAGSWVRSWLYKADQLPRLGIALDDDPIVERITPSTAARFGRHWRNCLAAHAIAMASGVLAYVALSDPRAIAVLTRMEAGWLLTGLHGWANWPISANARSLAKDHLEAMGVICMMPAGPPADLRAISEWLHPVDDLEFGLEGLG